MMDFIYNLYESKDFTLYLTIVLVILVIAFILVFIFGKRDQKLEETKRLERIELEKNNKDAFKEEKVEPLKLEAENNEVNEKEETTEIKVEKEEIELPNLIDSVVEEKNEELPKEVNVTIFEPEKKETEEAIDKEELPEIERKVDVEEVPLFSFDDINDSLEQGLTELKNIKEEFNNIEVPEVIDAVEEEMSKTKSFQPSKVFSSVFVNNKDEENNQEQSMENEPLLSIEPNIKIENNAPEAKPTLILQDDEDEFELPDLKITSADVKTETKAVEEVKTEEEPTTFNFDNLVDETYEIK